MKTPFFSIVIPTYNRAAKLQFALYCILQQSFKDYEIVISDNCSTDSTKEMLDKLNNKKIYYYKTKKTVIYPRNIKNALKHTKGKYIFFHSDDDILLYKDSLQKIFNKINEYNVGYIRPKYVCVTPERKSIFSFKIAQPLEKNQYIPPFSNNKKILNFLINSDMYFITGIIYKNTLPKNIKMLDSEHGPWVRILFYSIEKWGALFMVDTHVVASWSKWRLNHNPVYEIKNGKLESESYFDVVKKKIHTNDYNLFFHSQLKTMYVFPLIKLMVGNEKMLRVASRVKLLDPTIIKTPHYWIYLIIALILPRVVLLYLRNIFLFLYIRFSKVNDDIRIINRLQELEKNYYHEWETLIIDKKPIFNFSPQLQ